MARRPRATRNTADFKKELEVLSGYIEHVIFPAWGRESKNGFAILRISLSGDSKKTVPDDPFNEEISITAKGTMPHPKVGDEIKFKGYWVNDPNYSRQFNFTEFEIILPTSQQGVIAYFSSDKFYGLGRVAAEKILAALGENCLNMLKDNPELAYEIPGLSEKQQHELAQKMAEHSALGDLIAMICRHGIGTSTARRIFSHYGPDSLKIVKENPYQLIKDIEGIGFDKADSIGTAVGIKRNSDFRIQAAIRHVLEEAKSEGHCALRSSTVTDKVIKLLGAGSGVETGDVARIGRGMIEAGELHRERDIKKNIDLVYLIGMWEAESGLADIIRSKVGDAPGVTVDVIEKLVDGMESSMGIDFKLAPEQRQAVVTALLQMESVVTGGPGTGKSTITKLIKAGYESLYPINSIYLVSPTGRAAKRLAEATGGKAMTIHRQLGYNPECGFSYDENCQLPGPGLMIIDEASMMDIELSCALFKAIPDNMQVVIIGDIDQLPSVGPGAVLRDIIHSGIVPTTRLKYIYRQEEGSTISLLADMINRYDETKKMANLKELEQSCGGRDFQFIEAGSADDAYLAVQQLITDEYMNGLQVMDFQVLTPLKDRGAASAKNLNNMLRDIVNPAMEGISEKIYGDKIFRDGDKVMKVKKNDYKKMLFNGDIGRMEIDGSVIFNLDGFPITLSTEDLANIELAYAFTVHKSQGGEAPFVPVICIKSHYIMLQRNLIYTAITRAKKKLVLVGSQDAFEIAVKNNKIERRFGLLKERLRGEFCRDKSACAGGDNAIIGCELGL